MSLDGILDAIRREADEELAALAAERDRELADRRSRAAAAAARVEAEAALTRDSDAAVEAARRVRRAGAEAARLLRAAREEAFASARALARERLGALLGGAAYPAVLAALLAESRAALPGAAVVRVDSRDEALAGLLVEGLVPPLKVDPSLERCSGGLELVTDDGRLVVDTFEARLERAEPELRRIMAELLATPAPGAPGD